MEEKNLALQFAMKLIGLRRRSVFEIEERLKEKSYSEDIISYVIEELKKYKYLDDKAFADSFIRDRINLKPCGKMLMRKDLFRKGISEVIINEKLSELMDENTEKELANRLISKKIKTLRTGIDKNKARRKLAAYLSSKGFPFDIISQTLENKLK